MFSVFPTHLGLEWFIHIIRDRKDIRIKFECVYISYSERKNTKKPNIYFVYAIALFVVILIATIWVMFLFHPLIDFTGVPTNATGVPTKIAAQTVPTLVNGIIAATSVIIGFTGTIIGILIRDFMKDTKARTFLILITGLFGVSFTYPWASFIFLAIGLFEFAVKWALVGFLLSLFLFMVIILFAFSKLSLEKEEKSDTVEPDKKTKETKKTVNAFVGVY